MGARVRGLIVVVVVLVTGAFLGSAVSQWWHAPTGSDGGPPALPIFGGERIRVEVLNGGGRAGMARAATDLLRDRRFDVVYFGNDTVFDRDSSVVVARSGRLDWARGVADALGVRTVRSEADPNLYLDVSVVLGSDWTPDSLPSMQEEGEEIPWWDPRSWLRRPGAPQGDSQLADPPTTGSDDTESENR